VRYRELRYTEAELATMAGELGELGSRGVETYAFLRHGDAPYAPRGAMWIAVRLESGSGVAPGRRRDVDDGGATARARGTTLVDRFAPLET
jgi:hypothetical protein